jgi:hypothetical protein
LQNQSATAVAQVFSASQMRIKLIARIMAEGVRDIFALLHGTIRKHGQQQQTVRLRNAWINVNPRNWKTRDDMTINVGLGSGGKAQQFAQAMAIANVQKQLLAGGKSNLVGDRELYNTAAELTRIMGHKNPDRFFCDPTAVNPRTGQLLHPPPVPPSPPPDPKLLAAQARLRSDQAAAAQRAQIEQQRAQNAAIHLQVKAQAEIELARIKAELDAKMALLDAHLKAATAKQSAQHAQQQHHAGLAETALGMIATAHEHDAAMGQRQDAKIRNSVPGARRARDGKHYVPDPARPGKFLMVVPNG